MEEDAGEVYKEVLELDLHRIPEFDTLSGAQFAAIYNGCGPDSWPENLRDVMTWVLRNFKPVIAVHDVEYAFSDGTRKSWDLTQAHWRMNLSYVVAHRYPLRKFWLLPLRVAAWAKARAAMRVLAIGSWPVYRSAWKRRRDEIRGTSAAAEPGEV